MLEIDRRNRTISGRAIPWNIPALVNRRWVALEENSLTWPERVWLIVRHDHSLTIGKSLHLESASDGLYVTFRALNGPRGDWALALAQIGWGFSCGFDSLEFTVHDSVAWCSRGQITEISLVPEPAFP